MKKMDRKEKTTRLLSMRWFPLKRSAIASALVFCWLYGCAKSPSSPANAKGENHPAGTLTGLAQESHIKLPTQHTSRYEGSGN